jgi:hypothetical protein
VFISGRLITGSIEAENGRDRRRNYNLYSFTKTVHKQIAGRIAIIGTIRQKTLRQYHITTDLKSKPDQLKVCVLKLAESELSHLRH